MKELIVPIRDRRQRKRIITLKNFGRFAIAIAILFAGLTIRSEMHHTNGGDDYGHLFGKQVAHQTDVAKPKFDVIKEAPVADETKADPLLLEPAARSQYLGVESTMAPVALPAQPTPSTVSTQPIGHGESIVGDQNGVTIVRGKSDQRPVLSGGIFKQQ